jgi:hypothetical protein
MGVSIVVEVWAGVVAVGVGGGTLARIGGAPAKGIATDLVVTVPPLVLAALGVETGIDGTGVAEGIGRPWPLGTPKVKIRPAPVLLPENAMKKLVLTGS